MYKLVKGSKGNRWMKDGKFISEKNVPEEAKQEYFKQKETQAKVNTELEELDKKCIVCGGAKEHQRMILGKMVALCDSDYYGVSYGYIAGILKEKGVVNVH